MSSGGSASSKVSRLELGLRAHVRFAGRRAAVSRSRFVSFVCCPRFAVKIVP
jgi:hypothetical protein